MSKVGRPSPGENKLQKKATRSQVLPCNWLCPKTPGAPIYGHPPIHQHTSISRPPWLCPIPAAEACERSCSSSMMATTFVPRRQCLCLPVCSSAPSSYAPVTRRPPRPRSTRTRRWPLNARTGFCPTNPRRGRRTRSWSRTSRPTSASSAPSGARPADPPRRRRPESCG